MIKHVAFLCLIIFSSNLLFAQQRVQVDLLQNKSKIQQEQVKVKANGFVLYESIAGFEITEKNTKEGTYGQMVVDGLSKTYYAGNPDLPVINRLIEMPHNSDVEIKIIDYEEEIITLSDKGFKNVIIPAQPSHSKSQDEKDIPFEKNREVYSKNEFYKRELVKFEDKGYLRNKHLGYLEISPFMYNPVTNVLKVLNNIELEITFVQSTKTKVLSKANLQSPYFDQINYNVINQTNDSKALVSDPVKYVIIADRMFEETLQDFILWKTQKGFNVVEAYTDVIGTTTSSIKTYLQDLYENPADDAAPTFVLLVGDVAQIPTFSGSAGGHKTDLYYFEYTGDKLPEVFYGRFSAESVEELQPQIDKTLEIEKYEMPDPAYLDNVVLVAGVDGSYAPTYGNGAINYANAYYTNSDNGVNSYYYLYGDASGVMSSNNSEASASIRSYISAGVSLSNYTAHCGVSGWSDPSFSTAHIDGLTNEHMYPLIIGNCCQSNTFAENDCFGEKILMAANKGAVGYIGGSNNTYWDEDYHWGIGLTSSIEANPTYEESGLGAYDRFFHLKGEDKSDWYITQGQINVAGNLAVEASTSSRKAYYWEIYHLMGDPSLTPYVTVPSVLTASYDTEAFIGNNSFEVTAEENAYVALSDNGELLDAALVDESGSVTLNFDALSEATNLDLVITRQNRQPIIDQIEVIPASSPYITLDYHQIDDVLGNSNSEADYGEIINLDIQLQNVSDTYDAINVVANLSSADTNIVITDNTENIGTILKSDSAVVKDAYTIQLKDKIADQHVVPLELEITGKDAGDKEYTWISAFNLVVNAPVIEINELFVDDKLENDNGILDPGETVDISVVVNNSGRSLISDLTGYATILGDGATHLTLNDIETSSFSINALETDTIRFNATANANAELGTLVYLTFNVDDAFNNFYSVSSSEELSIGEIPEILISDNDTIISDKAYFYDTGGSYGNYSNDERDTITIEPINDGKYLSVEFQSFSVEPNGGGCYDYLKIFDGENTDANLIGTYCDSNKPDIIKATNAKGALTFAFYSDYSEIRSGWEAEVRSVVGYDYTLTVNGKYGPVEGATVELLGRTQTTDVNGIVSFYNIPEGINYVLNITALGYKEYETSINILNNTTDQIAIEEDKFDVTFNLLDEDGTVDGDITFDGKTLSTEDGSVIFENVIYSTNKTYLIEAFGHADSTATIEVTSDITLDIDLKIYKYNVEFIITDGTDPIQDAIVEFNNEDDYTNINGIVMFEQVKMDTALIYTVRKTGYNNLTDTIDVAEDLSLNLAMSSGTAAFKVTFEVLAESSPLYNAQVILNEDTSYTNPDGVVIFSNVIEATNIPYKISKVHFDDVVGTIDIKGDSVVIDTTLEYRSYDVVFNVNDGERAIENAAIEFNEATKYTNSQGICTFSPKYSLNQKYKISKEGFKSDSAMINVDANKSVDILLELLKYNVTFIVKDPLMQVLENVLVEFNSNSKYTDSSGEALFSEVLPENEMEFSLSADGFWNYDSTLNVVNENIVFNAIMSSTTSVKQLQTSDIKIYPNPSNGQFNIEIRNSTNDQITVKVFNVLGSLVYHKNYSRETNITDQIDISKYAKGFYFISIESDKGNALNKRLIVN